jgi:GTP-binding protein Era
MVTEAFREPDETELSLIDSIKKQKTKAILVINKIDCIKDMNRLAKLIDTYRNLYSFEEIIPASAQSNDNLNIVLDSIVKNAPEMPHFFPDDTLTDQPEKVIVAELIREKILQLLRDEVPHGVAVSVDKMRQREDKEILDINATIYCERKSHKGIIIGKSGSMLKKIGSLSRKDIEEFIGMPVNLQCWVKICEDWRNKEGLIKEFGLSNE